MAKKGPSLEFEAWASVVESHLAKAGQSLAAFAEKAEAAFAMRMHPAKFAGKALAGAL